MLHVHHSNRMERLRDRLIEVTERPLANPLAPETIVVQHLGMGRWLALALARHHGIAANLHFPFPASFVWEMFTRTLTDVPDTSAFDRDVLTWRIMALLADSLEQPGFEAPRHYLGGGDALKRYQLARRIADVFDQYLVYRPDWIENWEAGTESHWQAQLWRAVVTGSDGQHRASLLRRFIARCDRGEIDPASLPERISVFGISSLPPAYLETFARLGELVEVHLFVLNPCVTYWGDVIDERALARLRARWRRTGRTDASQYYAPGHPLLASTGRLLRDFLDLLHACPCADDDAFEPPDHADMLGLLQADMLMLQDRADGVAGAEPVLEIAPDDDSIQIHACHTPLREVQVLHDRLLAMFAADPTLQPQDIVVMMPRVEDYAPFIHAVFGAAPAERRIPWSIADRTLAATHPLVQVFLRLLALPSSRFQASEVLGILEVPAVLRCFRLDAAAFERIRDWVAGAGIRWGLDGATRARSGLPELADNTWRFGFSRLLLGYAMPAPATGRERLFHGHLPYPDIEGSEAVWLGQLQSFLIALDHHRRALGTAHTPADWVAVVNDLLSLFQPADESETLALQSIRDAIGAVAENARLAAFEEPLTLDVVREELQTRLTEPRGGHRFLTGRVTFCAMMPMRSVPFRVVCLIGMNDADFPRRQIPLGFDRMAQAPRPGDRSRRGEDRMLFLEALLSARQRLYISHVGRSVRDNTPKLPSVLVSELMDTLERGFRHPDRPLREHLRIEHPLQPFNAAYFGTGDARLFSYADEWEAGARALQGEPVQPPFVSTPLPPPEEALRQVSLASLIRFFKNPARAFLRQRLGIHLDRPEDAIDDDEAFAIDGLRAYACKQQLLRHLLDGIGSDDCYRIMRAAGDLPMGPFGRQVFDGYHALAEPMIERLQPYLDQPQDALDIDLGLGRFRLTGSIGGLTAHGLVHYRLTRVKAGDRLALWLTHLALNAAAEAQPSRHFGEDTALTLRPLETGAAREQLLTLLEAWWRGLHEPLPFFPGTSLAYAGKIAKGQDAAAALDSAVRGRWLRNNHTDGEADDADVQLAFRGVDALGADFDHWACTLALPLLDAIDGGSRT